MKLSDKVIIAIKNDIATGKLKKGEKIPAEPELMELYEVGRSTIREAIKTLAISGILKVQQGSGTFVTSVKKDESLTQRLRRADFDEVNTVRFFLEKEIVRLACLNRSQENLNEMHDMLEQRKNALELNHQKKCIDADIKFHISVAKASGNSIFLDLYQNFTVVIRDFFNKRGESNITSFAETHHLHQELADAIANRDQESAEQLIKTILHNNY